MIPIKLTIQGMFSYQKEQTIEFNNLLNDQIFGIFGGVGSGKSSILEAITFALYGKLDKMNSRDGINYNLMNLKSNTLQIDFEFTNTDNENYRFVVSGKRNSKNFEDVGTLKKKQYKLIDSKWIADEYSAEDIIGLSYENFKRTIIIPQGKFMEFLQLGDTDRTSMLKEIFSLGKYDLSLKLGIIEKDNNSSIDNLEGQIEQYKDTNKEELKELEENLKNIKAEKKVLDTSLGKKTKQFQELRNVKTLFENLKTAQNEFNTLNLRKSEFEEKEKQLKAYEICLAHFKPLLDSHKSLSNKERELKDDIVKERFKLKRTENSIKEKTILYEQADKEFKKIENYKLQADEFGKLISIINYRSKLTAFENKINTINGIIKVEEVQKEALNKKIEQLNTDIKDLEKSQIDISELSQIKEWFVKKDGFEEDLKKLTSILVVKKELFIEVKNKKQTLIPERNQAKLNIDFSKSIAEIINLLNVKIKESETKLKEVQDKREKLIVNKKLEEFSASLEDGSACPVCGSLEHPSPINFEGIDEKISKLQIQSDDGKQYVEYLRTYISSFSILNTKINNANDNVTDIESQHSAKQNELKNFERSYKWKSYNINEREKLNADFEKFEKIKEAIRQKRTAFDMETLALDKKVKNIEISTGALTKLMHSKIELSANINTLIFQIEIIDIKIFEKKSEIELDSIQNRLREKIETIEKEYQSLGEAIEKLKLDQASIASLINSLEKQLSGLLSEIEKLNVNISATLQKYNYTNIQTVEEVLELVHDVEKERNIIKEFYLKLNSAQIIVKKLKAQTKGKLFDKENYIKLEEDIVKLTKEVEGITAKIGGFLSTIAQIVIDLKKKKDIQEQLKEKELRATDLKSLKSLFNKQGFVQYVSTVYLQQLIDYANARFHKLTKQSLSLVLGKNNNFDVIDYLNDGRRRSVKTLSGGQTFQASLSLALALAGSVQKLNKSDQNFFFLDEGFGTQDEESLRLVFDAIKSLRKENRIVGVISHVDELQDEISTHLRIIKDDKQGSIINTSW